MIFRGHSYGAEKETGKGGMLVENFAALGVDVEEVEGRWRGAGAFCQSGFDATEKQLEDRGFEGVEEEGEGGGAGEVEGEDVLLVEADGSKPRGGGVGCVGGDPVVQIALRGVGEGGIEFDADDLVEGEFAGDEHGAAFAGTDVDEGVVGDGVGWVSGPPEVDKGAENAGGDAVVGGDVGVVGMAGDEVAGSDEAAGLDSVDLVEGVLRRLRGGRHERGFGFAGWHGLSADLDEIGVAVEAQDLAAGGGDAEGRPWGLIEEGDGGLAYGFEAGEAVCDLGAQLGVDGFVGLCGGEFDLDLVFLRDAGDVGAGGFEVGGDVDGVDQPEVYDVAGQDGVVAVAECEEDVGLGEHLCR